MMIGDQNFSNFVAGVCTTLLVRSVNKDFTRWEKRYRSEDCNVVEEKGYFTNYGENLQARNLVWTNPTSLVIKNCEN